MLALAGLVQALRQVRQIAENGQADEAIVEFQAMLKLQQQLADRRLSDLPAPQSTLSAASSLCFCVFDLILTSMFCQA